MKASLVRDKSQIGLFDYTLVGIGSALAVYSAGMAVNEQSISAFSASLVVLGTVFSFLIRVFFGRTRFVQFDGIIYTAAVILAIVLLRPLNGLLPVGGFPREVIMASALSWMLILGSFFAWRDGTLLFQAIPAIALFGLVGCYDTFRNVIYAFFGFLLCLATLFARAHTREMIQQAVDSGWFTRADLPGKSTALQRSMALYERIREGPWRWLAGPEWALASALAVVLVSVVGAPVIRESVREVSGTVKLPAPPIRSQLPPVVGNSAMSQVRVGQGPLGPLSEVPLFEAKLDRLRYLRGAAYDVYEDGGWRIASPSGAVPLMPGFASRVPQTNYAIEEMQNRSEFDWAIRPLLPSPILPMPGEPVAINNPMRRRLSDGGSRMYGQPGGRVTITGRSVEPERSIAPDNAVSQLPNSLLETTSLAGVPEIVKQLARDASRGGTNDYERALQIKREIGRRAKYNLRAPAIPIGQDPVETFLFQTREGYCDLFASSMVVMARSIGIPARYTTGFLPSSERFTNGNFVVVQADAHAWAELFFEGHGWVVFDATEDAEEVVNAGRGDATARTPWYQTEWFKLVLDIGIVLGVVVAGLLLWRSMRPAVNADKHKIELDRLYLRFVKVLERRSRLHRRLSQTPDEFLQVVGGSLNGSSEAARDLTREFERAFYSPTPVDEGTVANLRQNLRNFEETLRKPQAKSK